METLKPCPFCGGNADLCEADDGSWYVGCVSCGCGTNPSDASEDAHAAAWNRRTTPAMRDILDERARQDAKWGVQNHNPAVWAVILGEEVGEAVDSISRPETPHGDALQALVQAGNDCRIVLENRELLMQTACLPGRGLEMYRAEMVQVAAVALAAVECVDRLSLLLEATKTEVG